MDENYEIDNLDRKILTCLSEDAWTSFQEIARKLIVSGGTIHVRVNKMKEMGIIKGARLDIDYTKLGYAVQSFIGVNFKTAGDYQKVVKALKTFPEVVEVHYTTGQYGLFVKIQTKTIRDLHLFLSEKLQGIEEIRSSETFIALDSPVLKNANIE